MKLMSNSYSSQGYFCSNILTVQTKNLQHSRGETKNSVLFLPMAIFTYGAKKPGLLLIQLPLFRSNGKMEDFMNLILSTRLLDNESSIFLSKKITSPLLPFPKIASTKWKRSPNIGIISFTLSEQNSTSKSTGKSRLKLIWITWASQ